MSFEVFARSYPARRSHKAWITLSHTGVAISPVAYAQLGRPAAMELALDRAAGVIRVSPSDGPDAYRCAPQSSGWVAIHSKRFLEWVTGAPDSPSLSIPVKAENGEQVCLLALIRDGRLVNRKRRKPLPSEAAS